MKRSGIVLLLLGSPLASSSSMNHHHHCSFAPLQQLWFKPHHGRSITSSPLLRRMNPNSHHRRRNNIYFNSRSCSYNYNNNGKVSSDNNITTLFAQRERRITTGTSSDNNVGVPSDDNATTEQLSLILKVEETARQKRSGQAKSRIEKAARRENRISQLENMLSDDVKNNNHNSSSSANGLSDSERAELEGLLRTRENFEEQYNAETFTAEHVEFKRLHNEAFAALARFCQRDRHRRSIAAAAGGGGGGGSDDDHEENNDYSKDPNVFYLDGPDTATSSALIEQHGFDPSCCYVANRHLSTFKILQHHLPEENVLHATAAEALTPPSSNSNDRNGTYSFSGVDFAAFYFDGCGGFTPHIIGMMSAALIRPDASSTSSISSARGRTNKSLYHPPKTTAIGYSLMGGNKDVVEKEMDINRALSNIARTRGMRTRHVLDDPWRYGVPAEIAKTEGGTFTSWMLLEEDEV
ncbi:hypothetical protein ACHAXM_004876 [Skeletonema potamos]